MSNVKRIAIDPQYAKQYGMLVEMEFSCVHILLIREIGGGKGCSS
jgi:hypothetical protein